MEFSSAADVMGSKVEKKEVDKSQLPNAKLGQFKIIKMMMRDASENGQGVLWTND